MNKVLVNLESAVNVKKFVVCAQTKNCRVELRSDKWCVDGKSILGIFSLDLSKPIELYIEDNDYELFKEFMI